MPFMTAAIYSVGNHTMKQHSIMLTRILKYAETNEYAIWFLFPNLYCAFYIYIYIYNFCYVMDQDKECIKKGI